MSPVDVFSGKTRATPPPNMSRANVELVATSDLTLWRQDFEHSLLLRFSNSMA
jgi:hypothetical protein